MRLKGLTAPVEIVRDRWGIPHISARDPLDAFFGQGFCHAQDRLWQMELTRRLAAVDSPRCSARPRSTSTASSVASACIAPRSVSGIPPMATCATSCARMRPGVNACLDGLVAAEKLPVEFVLARFQPEPWEPIDTLGYARYLAFTQSPNWESELMRSRLIARIGYAAAAASNPTSGSPTPMHCRSSKTGARRDAASRATCRRSP